MESLYYFKNKINKAFNEAPCTFKRLEGRKQHFGERTMRFYGKKKVLFKWFGLNTIAALFLSMGALWQGASPWALWVGIFSYAVPEALFFMLAFNKTGATHLQAIHKGFALGFAVKFFMTLFLLSCAFYFMVSPGQVLIGFVVSIVLSWRWLFKDLEELQFRGKK